jgi:hypothetical protein
MDRKHFGIAAVVLAGTLVSPAYADEVLAGDDLIRTLPETNFNFGPGIGFVDFTGNPLDPNLYGVADTIIRRYDDTNFPAFGTNPWDGDQTPGTATTIDIELVALSLRSIEPVFVPGPDSFFDVFVTLDSELSSPGSMTLRHEWNDDGLFQGTFDSTFSIFADALFVPVGGGPGDFVVDIDNLTLSSTGALWNHDGPGGFYFPFVREEHPGFGVHSGEIVPTPGPLTAFITGLTLCSVRRRRT